MEPARTEVEEVAVQDGDLYTSYEAAFDGVQAPFAFVDLDALWLNADDMLRRAAGKPIRVASKSVRCRHLLSRILDRASGYRGLLNFTLAEALWLADHGFDDLVVAYPTVDREALLEAARRAGEGAGPVVMVDCAEHLDALTAATVGGLGPLRVCIDVDAGYSAAGGRVHIGPKRSPIRTASDAVALARQIVRHPTLRLVGIMAYEGQIAGVGDRPPRNPLRGAAIRGMQRLSATELRERRGQIVAAVREVADLTFVNGGGTGSLELTAADAAVTELAAGSGFYAPHLFDHYGHFRLRPAAGFALPVVRKPADGIATALGGGYLASGPVDALRLPVPWLPHGLHFDRNEGAGEVQTPLVGDAARGLSVGDRVYLRHSKAGELCERFATLYLLERGAIVAEVPTYRGEGRTFL